MPTFDVQIQVTVPGLGIRTVPYTGITAATMQAAIALAAANVVVIPLVVQQTAP